MTEIIPEKDENFIRRCLELGRIALDKGDAPVGSLISFKGEILSEGVEAVKASGDPTAHAEILAVKIACEKLKTRDLSGTTLYTNVEPCVMCAYLIRQTGVGRVFFGMPNLRVGGVNSKFAVLSDSDFPAKFAPPEICANILSEDCEKLWREFEAQTL